MMTQKWSENPAFWASVPAYILDVNYQLSAWNPAFDVLVAKPLGFKPRQHITDFVKALDNKDEVLKRSAKVFNIGRTPLVDCETLILTTKDFGQISFQKLASQVLDVSGKHVEWLVVLNILNAERAADVWQAVSGVVEARVRG